MERQGGGTSSFLGVAEVLSLLTGVNTFAQTQFHFHPNISQSDLTPVYYYRQHVYLAYLYFNSFRHETDRCLPILAEGCERGEPIPSKMPQSCFLFPFHGVAYGRI